MNFLRFMCNIPVFKKFLHKIFSFDYPQQKMGLLFSNPVGLGAGFDKNAQYLTALETLGFGFVEIGTVTPIAQVGNEKPRLFRLPKDKALINRMGFNNEGADQIATRLSKWRKKNPNSKMIIGGNIGKNKLTPNEDAWKDYEFSFHKLHDYVDYFVVNVSSPNTPGLRELQEKDALKKIFLTLEECNKKKLFIKPILLKIAPDLSYEQIDDIIELTNEIELSGLIIANTTIDRKGLLTNKSKVEQIGAGGLSGLPLKNKCTSLIRYIHQKTNGKLLIIGSGGIFDGADAKEKIDAGASLVQVWTGFVYQGPAIASKLSRHLKLNK